MNSTYFKNNKIVYKNTNKIDYYFSKDCTILKSEKIDFKRKYLIFVYLLNKCNRSK
jgi:hypothetical protein